MSPEFISSVTDEVMAEVTAWQARPLEPMYPVVFFDALRVKIRDNGVVRNKAVYLALGVLPDGSGSTGSVTARGLRLAPVRDKLVAQSARYVLHQKGGWVGNPDASLYVVAPDSAAGAEHGGIAPQSYPGSGDRGAPGGLCAVACAIAIASVTSAAKDDDGAAARAQKSLPVASMPPWAYGGGIDRRRSL